MTCTYNLQCKIVLQRNTIRLPAKFSPTPLKSIATFIANKRVYYKLRRTAVIKVAIVGAGPAGAYCAYKLAENAIYPSIFDYSHPREKPCGGLVPAGAQEFFPFLNNLPIPQAREVQ